MDHIARAIPAAGEVVSSLAERLYTGDPVELEVRFGRIREQNGRTRFTAGVSAAFFTRSMALILEYDAWSARRDAYTFHEFYYPLASDPRTTARTVVRYGAGRVETSHAVKRTIARRDLACAPQPDVARAAGLTAGQLSDGLFDLRVSAASESPLAASDVPDVVMPTFVRICERQSFTYERATVGGSGVVSWRYDFSRTWGARTKSECEQLQAHGAPVYEIEIELLTPRAYLEDESRTYEYVAESLLAKACDLFAPTADSVGCGEAPARVYGIVPTGND